MLRLHVCCLALLLAACLDMGTAPVDPAPNVARAPQGEHLWVFHIGSGQFASHVQLVAIGDQAAMAREIEPERGPTRMSDAGESSFRRRSAVK